jgi:mono/diheme cytochrome c family protein
MKRRPPFLRIPLQKPSQNVREGRAALHPSARVMTGSLVSLVLVFVAIVGCSVPDPVFPPVAVGDAAVAAHRGENLVKGFGACGFCHSADGLTGSPLAGGRLIQSKFGEVPGGNVTFASSGLGSWSDQDVKKVLRENLRPDGSEIVSDAHKGLGWASDADVSAITLYLRSLPPVEHEVERASVSFIDRNTTGFFDTRVEVKGYIPDINPSFKTEYGQYLTDSVARCGVCHSLPEGVFTSEQYLAGGQEISFGDESKIAPNITQSTTAGIGSWSEGDIRSFLLTGRTAKGREVDPRFCPVRFYAQAPADQVDAVVAYLRTAPAITPES